VDEGFGVDILRLDLVEAFDKVPYLRLLEKLRKHGMGGKLLITVGNWLSKRRQRVCVKGVESIRGRKSGAGFHRALSWRPCCFFLNLY